jgi:RecA/RadA recombinase
VSFNHEPDPPTGVSAAQPPSRPRLLQGQVELRPRGQLKHAGRVVGSRIRVQVTKNKVAPPWQVAELDVFTDRGVLAQVSAEAASA